ncbi:polysaccharide biosynthesis/export family protein [Sphingomonas qilianensis]|uniref:Polysaccharide biosynthesis/export family protein n=2 Tax=Sphingomonas qilianensis TaxID=1736690 RepID=A0ABU9XRB6_9SPHN
MLNAVLPQTGPRPTAVGISCIVALLLGGCATLPSSGPTGRQITRAAGDPEQPLPFPLIELDTLAAVPGPQAPVLSSLPAGIAPPTDLIGPGDVLEINIYEPGVALFGSSGMSGAGGQGVTDSSARVQKLPLIRVDDGGIIRIPFAGDIRAAGHTAAQVQTMIRTALRGLSQDPRVLVTIQQSITNSVILGGEVTRPGRLVLSTNRETLSDVIALAGGVRGDAKDVVARINRDDRSYDVRVSDLLAGVQDNVQIYPGDRITLVSSAQTFSVMGAPNRVEEIRFTRSALTLAEAVAQAGGSSPDRGDPAAIFVFRFVRNADGTEQPTVYHLNMMRAGAYFISQRFAMRDKDVLYIGNARANQPSKLIQIFSQLFAPIVTVRQTLNTNN